MPTDDDDDLMLGAVPEPDDEATAAERAHARTFAELVDKALVGQAPPAAMSADDRALLEVATVIRATSGGMPLAPSRQRSIIEDALAKAIGGGTRSTADLPSAPSAPVLPLVPRSKRRFVPWAIAGASSLVAAAAIVLLVTRTPVVVHLAPTARAMPVEQRSRPTDVLIGPIARKNAGDAGSRIDTIFADRLDGFRDRTLEGHRP